ncbi:MAG: chorismate mutase, partial [Pseudomonadota bacterium]
MNDKNQNEQAEIRSNINRVDSELLKLLAERRALTLSMGKFKDRSGSALRDQEREQNLLKRLTEEAKPLGLDQYFITNLYHVIFEDSIRGQERYLTATANMSSDATELRVTFEGNTGSYSYLAASQ